MERKSWKLDEWNDYFHRLNHSTPLPPMTDEEINEGIKWLRDNHYPMPEDCPLQNCPAFRPACQLKVCHIAVQMCGDF